MLVVVAMLLSAQEARGTHAMAMDIYYEHVDSNKYQITLIIFRDCAGVAAPTNASVDVTSSNCSFNSTVPLTLQPAPAGGREVSPLCPPALSNSTCNGGTNPGVEKYIYIGEVDLGANHCNDWVFSYFLCCRNNAITNLTTPGTQIQYVHCTMDNTTYNSGADTIRNNSPQFTSIPTPFICVNQSFNYNHGAVDPDGDSLVFYRVNSRDGSAAGDTIPFALGHSINFPVVASPSITTDSSNGQMAFLPTTLQQCVITMQVEEWRDLNGTMTKIGTTIRDLQVIVMNCSNIQPYINTSAAAGIQVTSGTKTDSMSMEVCPGDTAAFWYIALDPNGDNVFQTSNIGPSNMPTATYTTTCICPVDTGYFTWVPTGADVGLHTLVLTVQDDGCPVLGAQWYAVNITVLDGTVGGPDLTYCGIPVQLNATGGTSFTWSVVSGDSIDIGVDFSCNPCADPFASPSVTTTYVVSSNQSSTCGNTDTVVVTVDSAFTLTPFPDTTICENGLAALSAQPDTTYGSYTYNWSPSGTLSSSTDQTVQSNTTDSTTYYVTVTSSSGCERYDTIDVNVSGVAPVVTADPDTAICSIDTVQLYSTVNLAQATYAWSPNYNMDDSTTANPMVWPDTTTTYRLDVTAVQLDSTILLQEFNYPDTTLQDTAAPATWSAEWCCIDSTRWGVYGSAWRLQNSPSNEYDSILYVQHFNYPDSLSYDTSAWSLNWTGDTAAFAVFDSAWRGSDVFDVDIDSVVYLQEFNYADSTLSDTASPEVWTADCACPDSLNWRIDDSVWVGHWVNNPGSNAPLLAQHFDYADSTLQDTAATAAWTADCACPDSTRWRVQDSAWVGNFVNEPGTDSILYLQHFDYVDSTLQDTAGTPAWTANCDCIDSSRWRIEDSIWMGSHLTDIYHDSVYLQNFDYADSTYSDTANPVTWNASCACWDTTNTLVVGDAWVARNVNDKSRDSLIYLQEFNYPDSTLHDSTGSPAWYRSCGCSNTLRLRVQDSTWMGNNVTRYDGGDWYTSVYIHPKYNTLDMYALLSEVNHGGSGDSVSMRYRLSNDTIWRFWTNNGANSGSFLSTTASEIGLSTNGADTLYLWGNISNNGTNEFGYIDSVVVRGRNVPSVTGANWFTSFVVDSNYNRINLSAKVWEVGNTYPGDSLNFSYRINSGAWSYWDNNGENWSTFDTSIVTQNNIAVNAGDTLHLWGRVVNDTSFKYGYIDSVRIHFEFIPDTGANWYTSIPIDSGFNEVDLFGLGWEEGYTANDSLNFYYKLNSGSWSAWSSNGQNVGNFDTVLAISSKIPVAWGDTLHLWVRAVNTDSTEIAYFDSLLVRQRYNPPNDGANWYTSVKVNPQYNTIHMYAKAWQVGYSNNQDSLNFYYKVNNGSWSSWSTNGTNVGSFAANRATHTNLSVSGGDSLHIWVRAVNDSITEQGWFDSLIIKQVFNDTISGANWYTTWWVDPAFNTIDLYAKAWEEGYLNSNDSLSFAYKINNGSWNFWSNNGNNTGDFDTVNVSSTGISVSGGDSLHIWIRAVNDSVIEYAYFDSLVIRGKFVGATAGADWFTSMEISPTYTSVDMYAKMWETGYNASTDSVIARYKINNGSWTNWPTNGVNLFDFDTVQASATNLTVSPGDSLHLWFRMTNSDSTEFGYFDSIVVHQKFNGAVPLGGDWYTSVVIDTPFNAVDLVAKGWEDGFDDSQDSVIFRYKINNGAWTLFPNNGANVGDFDTIIAAASDLSVFDGDSVHIWVHMTNVGNATAYGFFDSLLIREEFLSDCEGADFVTITVGDTFSLATTASELDVCRLEGSQLTTTPSQSGTYTYSWTPTSSIPFAQITASNPWVYPSDTTNFVVEVDNGGCIRYDSITVNVRAAAPTVTPWIDSGYTQNLCAGDTTSLSASAGVVAVCTSYVDACTSPTIGDSVGGSNIGQLLSMGLASWNGFSRKTQSIYLPTELASMGMGTDDMISSVAYYVTSVGGAGPIGPFTIKMGCTDATGWSSDFTDFVPESGLITMADDVYYNPSVGWNTINFDSSYVWDGQSNLVVQVCIDTFPTFNTFIQKYETALPQRSYVSTSNSVGQCSEDTGWRVSPTVNIMPMTKFGFCAAPASPNADMSFSWTPTISLSNPNDSTTLAYPTTTTTYVVTAYDSTLTDACIGTASITVNAGSDYNITSISATPDTICAGETSQLNATVDSTQWSFIYNWSPGDPDLDDSTIINPLATPDTTTNYVLSVTRAIWGCEKFDTVTVNVSGRYPTMTASVDLDTICPGDTATLSVNITNALFDTAYAWSPSTGLSDDSAASPLAFPDTTTLYTVTVNDGNCSDTTSVLVIVSTPELLLDTLGTCLAFDSVQMTTTVNGITPTSVDYTTCGAVSDTADSTLLYDVGNPSVYFGGGPHPFYGTYQKSRLQILYTQGELAAAGLGSEGAIISSLSFYISTAAYSQEFQGYTVKLGCTSTDALSTANGFISPSSMTTVYSGDYTATGSGWAEIVFDTMYQWNGDSNIVVEICWDSLGAGSGNCNWAYEFTNPVNSAINRFDNVGTGCNMVAVNQYVYRPIARWKASGPILEFQYNWTPGHLFSDSTIEDPLVLNDTLTWVYLEVTGGECPVTDSMEIGCVCDTIPPYIEGSATVDTSEYLSDSTFRVKLSEAIVCSTMIGPLDFKLFCDSSTTTGACLANSIVAVTGDSCSVTDDSTTVWLTFELDNPVPGNYQDDWMIEITDTNAILDICGNEMDSVGLNGASGRAVILPIELLYFTGYLNKNEDGVLNWESALEIGTDYYVIERSLDGITWIDIGQVNAVGAYNRYELIDYDVQLGYNYYRLRSVDHNGAAARSHIVTLKRNTFNFELISVRPVPTMDYVKVKFASDVGRELDVEVMNLLGEVLTKFTYEPLVGINEFSIDMVDLQGGVYMLRIRDGNTVKLMSKLIKAK